MNIRHHLKTLITITIISLILTGCTRATPPDQPIDSSFEINFDGYRLIEVEGGDQSGDRQASVVVDIGYGDRLYYAFTNEYGQLVKVAAYEIILQDDSSEPVLKTGRYYHDEAKVPGVESPTLDEGHVIADSLGGVSNAYNITPQESTLNRHGDQAYMEKVIRQAGGCTDFEAIITYPNTETQIPSAYSFTYTINGKTVHDAFENIDPEGINEFVSTSDVTINELDKKLEYIILENTSNQAIDLSGWKIVSVRGGQTFVFDNYVLEGNSIVKIGDSALSEVDIHWLDGNGTWSNSKSDPAELYNSKGVLVDKFID